MPIGRTLLTRAAMLVLAAALLSGWLSACSDSDIPATVSSPTEAQDASGPQARQEQPAQDAGGEQDAAEQSAGAVSIDREPANDPQQQSSQQAAANSQSAEQTQADTTEDPYGASDAYESDDADVDQAETHIPPIRDWLTEGVSLTPSAAAEWDEYGWTVVIEGNVIAVGAPYHDQLGIDTGAVFVFERVDDDWIETAYILPPYPDPEGWFGRWLAIDAGRLVIGAPYEDWIRPEDGVRIVDSGAAYVFEKRDDVWQRTATLAPHVLSAGASFGWSVAIHDERIAVSAWNDEVEGVAAGSVTVYREHKGLWQAEAYLTPNNPSERQLFGRDIELERTVLVVGAPGDDTIAEDAGALFVWHYYADEWHFVQKLIAAEAQEVDSLGYQVSMSVPWIGAGAHTHAHPDHGEGAVYLWQLNRVGTRWNRHAKLISSDVQLGDWFGYSQAIQGRQLVIGAPHRAHPESGTQRSGAAYSFELIGDQWIEVGVLGPVNAVEAGVRAEFGWAVDISGQTAVVGAWQANSEVGDNAGAAAVYELPTDVP